MASNENFLESLMQANPTDFAAILDNRDSMRVQIVYTRIDRDKQNRPHFTDYFFNYKHAVYFYPASTVKMPVAFLAMEKANKLGIPLLSTMITEKGQEGLSAVYNDPTTADGRPSLAHYVKKIFLVSDNDANNRLYEFLDQQYLHDQLKTKGYPDAQIVRRLAIAMPESLHRITNPVRFLDTSGKLLYEQPLQNSNMEYLQRHDFLGKGYMNDSEVLVNEPMDFSRKNRVYLYDLHKVLRSVLFPAAVLEKERFDLKQEDYRFLYQYMSQLPSETRYPEYDTSAFYDAYCKFLLFGTQKHKSLPKHIRSFNKPGWSYGFLTDVAYIVDFEKNVEFMLSATIYCNSDGILNDDKYDYNTVGLPFLEKLGQTIYAYEVKRKRKHQPDLSVFKVNYDK
ncbi:serine hydrolase [Lacibacter luteus]|uniref:serine hydrolase n=1 Tax=Lacibacter luteus TaxID=2508719 RepID=UPI00197B200D|nr:serine hydrolase [Lacibacter luteus]